MSKWMRLSSGKLLMGKLFARPFDLTVQLFIYSQSLPLYHWKLVYVFLSAIWSLESLPVSLPPASRLRTWSNFETTISMQLNDYLHVMITFSRGLPSRGAKFVKRLWTLSSILFSVPSILDCGYCLVGGNKTVSLKCLNVGGPGRFCILQESDWPTTSWKVGSRSISRYV